MKPCVRNLSALPALVISLGLTLTGLATAQTFKTLHDFTGGSDGANPYAGLILSGNTLYGTATGGGGSANGVVYKVNTNGTGFTILHSFTQTSGNFSTNSDGATPMAGLILSGNTLYGTTLFGGSSGGGTVFAVKTNGTGFTNVYSFTSGDYPNYTNSDGVRPYARLILSGNTLYGTASSGGVAIGGTVYKVDVDGTRFTTLHAFSTSIGGSPNVGGSYPIAELLLSGNTLYGTAKFDGVSGHGTVFKLNTNGTDFTNLCSLTDSSDGSGPSAGLILSGNTLYGTTFGGGEWGHGTAFKVNTDGTGYTNLHSFTATSGPEHSINNDGAHPNAGLVLSGNTLFGTAYYGGTFGNGTVFAVNTDGTSFTVLHSFTGTTDALPHKNSDGAHPYSGLLLSGRKLYGTAYRGGSWGKGTVFELTIVPQLTIVLVGSNAILAWPSNFAGFDNGGFTLQSTTNLVPPAAWTTVSPAPVVVHGRYTVTNPISGAQQFYRLSQ